MLQNHYTIKKLGKEFQKLIGGKLIACFSQEKDTLMFEYYCDDRTMYLHFSVVPFCCSLFIYNDFARSKSNSVDLCHYLIGDCLQSVEIVENERIAIFKYINHSIVFHIFGGTNGNCFVLNKQDKIIFAINQPDKYIGNLLHTVVLHSAMSQETAEHLLYGDKVYILKNEGKTLLSLTLLADYEIVKEFDSISDAVKYQYIGRAVEQKKIELRKQLLPYLHRKFKRLIKNIKFAEDLDEPLLRADRCRSYADILMSQPNVKQRIGDKIVVKDWNRDYICIELDAKKTLLENANMYYVKSRKALQDAVIREKRIPKLKAELAIVTQKIETINNTESIKDIEKLKKEIIKESIVVIDNIDRPLDTKFRIFELGEGFTLYVGKNAANNDELTMKFAKSNDVWLHSRGSSGSHCIVRGGYADGKLPKPILKIAASIAAYYSGAKNAKYVPVCYTQKKYVHKPKGAAQGAVTLQREEVIIVEPKLPTVE